MSETPTPVPATAPTKAPRHRSPSRPKVAPFARYEGTSAWRKDRRRVRAYAAYLAAQAQTHPPAR